MCFRFIASWVISNLGIQLHSGWETIKRFMMLQGRNIFKLKIKLKIQFSNTISFWLWPKRSQTYQSCDFWFKTYQLCEKPGFSSVTEICWSQANKETDRHIGHKCYCFCPSWLESTLHNIFFSYSVLTKVKNHLNWLFSCKYDKAYLRFAFAYKILNTN